jgi:hypothetical protein
MGCPLAALCFVYALHQAIHDTNNTMTQMDTKAKILAYMDDMYIMVHPEYLKETMDNIKRNLTKIGLHLNEDKTTVWHRDQTTREQLKQHGYPTTDSPTVLKTTTLPIPVTPAPTASQGSLIAENGPEHSAVHRRRTKAAERIIQLQNAGLNHHTAQSLWRTYTASDATFLARTTGIDPQAAQALDAITTQLWQHWLGMETIPEIPYQLIWQPLKEGGMGFTAAKHLQGTALLASWRQVGMSILETTGLADMQTLVDNAPQIKRQLEAAAQTLPIQTLPDLLTMQMHTPPQNSHRKYWPPKSEPQN